MTKPTPNLSGFLRMIESLREGERLVFVSPRAGVISATLEKGFPTSPKPTTQP